MCSSDLHAYYGAVQRFDRHLASDHSDGFPVRRWLHQHDHPDLGRAHRHLGCGTHPLGKMGAVHLEIHLGADCDRSLVAHPNRDNEFEWILEFRAIAILWGLAPTKIVMATATD